MRKRESHKVAPSEEITMSTRTTRPDTSPLEAGYVRLNDKIDALRRLVTLIEVGTAIVLLVALCSLL